jgi:HlyD family secretion protein
MEMFIIIGIVAIVLWWLLSKVKSGFFRWAARLVVVAAAAGLMYVISTAQPQASEAPIAETGVITPLDEAGNPLPPVESTTVEQGDLPVTVSATGKIAPSQQSVLAFETPAIVREVLVSLGQTVRAGDVLARVDTTDLNVALLNAQTGLVEAEANYQAVIAPPREIDIQVAQAEVAAAQAGIYSASLTGPTPFDDQIAALQVQLASNSLWQAQLNRDLAGGGSGMWITPENATTVTGITSAQSEISVAQTNLNATVNRGPNAGSLASANGRLEQAQVALDNLLAGATAERRRRAEIDLENARLALQQAEERLRQAELRAPYDGVVAQINLMIGQTATRDRTVTLIDNAFYLLDLTVNESDIASVTQGQPVVVRLDAARELVLSGGVDVVGTVPIPVGTTASGAATTSQRVTYSVRVRLDPTDMLVRPGMSATGSITLETLADALFVPTRFLRTDPITLESLLTIPGAEPGTYQQIPVTIGMRNRDFTQITAGIEAGQEIVILPELPPQDAGAIAF